MNAPTCSQVSPEFSLFFTVGVQRRWFFDDTPAKGTEEHPDVKAVPGASNRAFLRMNTQYTFNPGELRQDQRNNVQLELSAYRPTREGDGGFLRFDAQGRWIVPIGWHELRTCRRSQSTRRPGRSFRR